MKPIKLRCVEDVRRIGVKRLQRMLQSRKITIKIRDGVKPEIAARIFRVLGTRIDDLRQNRSEK